MDPLGTTLVESESISDFALVMRQDDKSSRGRKAEPRAAPAWNWTRRR
jgi:hypothetical protein